MQCRKPKPHSKAARQQTDDSVIDLTDEPHAQEVTTSDPAILSVQSKLMSRQSAEAAKAATQQAPDQRLKAKVVDSAAPSTDVLRKPIKQSRNPAAQGKHASRRAHASTGKASVKPAPCPAPDNVKRLPRPVPASATGWPQAPASAPSAPVQAPRSTACHPVSVSAPASLSTYTRHSASAQKIGHGLSPTQAPAVTPRLAEEACSTLHHTDTHMVPMSTAEMGSILNGSLPAAHQLSQHNIQRLQAAFGDVASCKTCCRWRIHIIAHGMSG